MKKNPSLDQIADILHALHGTPPEKLTEFKLPPGFALPAEEAARRKLAQEILKGMKGSTPAAPKSNKWKYGTTAVGSAALGGLAGYGMAPRAVEQYQDPFEARGYQ